MYEGGIRVATIIRWPGVAKAGSDCETPIISNDYFPTIVEAAAGGETPQDTIDGVDLRPLIRGESIESGRCIGIIRIMAIRVAHRLRRFETGSGS